MHIRILAEADVREVISMREAIDVQAEAFQIAASGATIEGLRSHAVSEDPPGIAIFNPSFLTGGRGYGVKVVSDFYGNTERGVPRMNALVALFDGETGQPRTVMEGGYLTDLRTGAVTALAARHLARADSRVMTIIGAGRVARNQLEAMAEVVDLERVYVSTRSRDRGEAFVAQMSRAGGRVPRDIKLVEDRDAAIGQSDVVICATTSRMPVIDGARLRPGTFVASTGSHEATMREIDSETVRRATKFVIDSRRDCLPDAGDFQIPISEGILDAADVAEVAELVGGSRPGRDNAEEITIFKSIGVPIQDLVTAQRIEANAIARDMGTLIDIGGDHD